MVVIGKVICVKVHGKGKIRLEVVLNVSVMGCLVMRCLVIGTFSDGMFSDEMFCMRTIEVSSAQMI